MVHGVKKNSSLFVGPGREYTAKIVVPNFLRMIKVSVDHVEEAERTSQNTPNQLEGIFGTHHQ